MIVEFFLGLVTWLGDFILGMMPPDESGQMVVTASDALAGVIGMASGVSAWVPFGVIGIAAAFVFSAWGALFIVKIVRQLVAHIPQFGGTG